ncbi:MAG: phosphatase PAP2 family protein [Caldimonas sp.]
MPRRSGKPQRMNHGQRSAEAGLPWTVSLFARMRLHLALKLLGTTVVIGVFFVAYLHLLHHPAHAVVVMPLTALDGMLPFIPQALFVYLSLWVYVGAGPGFQASLPELLDYAAWSILLCVCGLAIFYFWPTQVPPNDLALASHVGFAMLQGIDAAGNACPSMHVAFAAFTLVRIDDVLRRIGAPAAMKVANLTWSMAIVLSTVAIRQHVVLDVVAGLALGVAFALASLRWSFVHAPGEQPHAAPLRLKDAP